MVALNDEGAPELGIVNDFLEGFWASFGDSTQACWVESDIRSIRQGNRSVAEYIWGFLSIARRLSGWPECLLVYQF